MENALLRGLPPRLKNSEGVKAEIGLEQKIVDADHLVDELSEAASILLDNLSHERSPTIASRLRQTETELEKARALLDTLREKREAASGPLVASRLARALEVLQPADRAMQPKLVNAALRGIFKRATINWPEGTVDLEYTHGGEFSVPFAMPHDALASKLRKSAEVD